MMKVTSKNSHCFVTIMNSTWSLLAKLFFFLLNQIFLQSLSLYGSMMLLWLLENSPFMIVQQSNILREACRELQTRTYCGHKQTEFYPCQRLFVKSTVAQSLSFNLSVKLRIFISFLPSTGAMVVWRVTGDAIGAWSNICVPTKLCAMKDW